MGKGFVKSLLAKYLPASGFKSMQPDDLRAVYIPVWFIDGEATGVVSKSGTEVRTRKARNWCGFHVLLGIADNPIIKLVRMTCRVRLFAGINVGLHLLGTCLVGPTILTPLARSSPVLPAAGFSFDPLSTLSFSQLDLEKLAVPFTPELRHQHGLDISCLPYSISPVSLPEVIESLSLSQSKLLDLMMFDRKSVEFSMVC